MNAKKVPWWKLVLGSIGALFGLLGAFLFGRRSTTIRRSGATGGVVSDPRDGIDSARRELKDNQLTDDNLEGHIRVIIRNGKRVAHRISSSNDQNRDIIKRIRNRDRTTRQEDKKSTD